MAEINQKDYIEGPAAGNSGWRFTCIDMSKGYKKAYDSKYELNHKLNVTSNLDLKNDELLEKAGFVRNANGILVMKSSNNTVEKSGKIVLRRVSEDGKVLYVKREKQKEQEERGIG